VGWRGLVTGIGDDCACCASRGTRVAVTTDFTIENVTFAGLHGLSWSTVLPDPRTERYRGMAENRGAFCRGRWGRRPAEMVDRFLKGCWLWRTSSRSRSRGDTAQAADGGGIQADIVVVGSVPHGKAVLRSGAKPARTFM